jgi:hypothetical protein
VSKESVIGGSQPDYKREWDVQCARCGSTIVREDCAMCGGDGVDGHDCGEDCCMCVDPEDNIRCDFCRGEGSYWLCLSSFDHCQAHPMPGRENVNRSTVEWFSITAPEVA